MPPVIYSQKQLLLFLSSLPREVLVSLYRAEWSEFACQAVFRALSPQARMYVLKALGGESLSSNLLAWKGNAKPHEQALEILVNLHILQEALEKSNAPPTRGVRSITNYKLSETFATGVKQALVHDLHDRGEENPTNQKQKEMIEDAAAEQWNNVLSFLVSSSGGILGGEEVPVKKRDGRQTKRARVTTTPSPVRELIRLDSTVQQALKDLGFVSSVPATEDQNGQQPQPQQQITSLGYEFMLKEVFEQVWSLVQHFVSQSPMEHRSSTIRFLFYLSFLKPGQEISIEQHSEFPNESISFFIAIGLIQPSQARGGGGGGRRFLVSSLGVHAMFGPSTQKKLFTIATSDESTTSGGGGAASTVDNQNRGHHRNQLFGLGGMRIIVETTFKVFCYTSSPMHSQMLQLFCQIEARLPNLVVAMITRESVSEAFKKGISDEQLISFLQQNAHPITRTSRFNIVPDNVTDQIRLWKRETTRITISYGRLFVMDKHPQLYQKVIDNAELDPFLPWKDDTSLRVFVKNEGNDLFKSVCNQARQGL